MKNPRTINGAVDTRASALISPYRIENAASKYDIWIGAVIDAGDRVMKIAIRKSLHVKMYAITAVLTSAGLTAGTTTRSSAPILVHPSLIALSSRDTGTSRK